MEKTCPPELQNNIDHSKIPLKTIFYFNNVLKPYKFNRKDKFANNSLEIVLVVKTLLKISPQPFF